MRKEREIWDIQTQRTPNEKDHMKTEEETEVIYLQAKGHQQLSAATRR